MSEIAMYMDNLDEYINDENKVVTYKWLSIQLSIPCNTAKRLLHHFVTTHEKEEAKEPLYVTYLVIGSTSLEDGQQETKVLVVPRSKLEAVKQSLSSVSCVHVYSVSKSCFKDLASTLYTTDYDCVRQNYASASKFGGIECPEAKARSDADIASLRQEATYRPSTPQDTRKAPDPRLAKPVDSHKQGGAKLATDDGKKTKPTTGGDKSKPSAKGSLANMFAAQKTAVKKEPKENGADKVKEEPNEASATGKKSIADKKAGRISGFFTKGANPREGEMKKEDEESRALRRSPRKSSTDKAEELEPDLDEKPDAKKVSPAKKIAAIKSPRKSTSTKRTKGRPTSQPKRSRIMLMDSDSSEEEEDQRSGSEAESPIPPSPPVMIDVASSDDEKLEPLPPSPQAAGASAGRGKKRKLVETTYMDDDGFFVTKKEYKDVTDSESEVPEPPPPKKHDCRESPTTMHEEEKAARSPKASPTKKTDGREAASSVEDEGNQEHPLAARTVAGRRKKRKLVPITFHDEGFLVTMTTYKDVTDSESKEPEPPALKKQLCARKTKTFGPAELSKLRRCKKNTASVAEGLSEDVELSEGGKSIVEAITGKMEKLGGDFEKLREEFQKQMEVRDQRIDDLETEVGILKERLAQVEEIVDDADA